MNLLMEDCELGDDKGSMPWAIKYKSHQSYAGALVNHTYRRLKVGKMAPTWQQPRAGFFISIELRYHPYLEVSTGTAAISIALTKSGSMSIPSSFNFSSAICRQALRVTRCSSFALCSRRGWLPAA